MAGFLSFGPPWTCAPLGRIYPGAPDVTYRRHVAVRPLQASKNMRDVLLVEDDCDVAKTLKEGLEMLGLGVHLAPSVAAAVNTMGVVRWDAVITDWSLADGSGMDVLRSAKELVPDARRVVLSGVPHPEAVEFAHRVLVKPVSLRTIAAAAVWH